MAFGEKQQNDFAANALPNDVVYWIAKRPDREGWTPQVVLNIDGTSRSQRAKVIRPVAANYDCLLEYMMGILLWALC